MTPSNDRPFRYLRIPGILLIIFTSLLSGGCFQHYYLVNSSRHIDSSTLLKLIDAQKYFIVHDNYHKTEFAISNLKVSNEILEADSGPLLSEHTSFLNPTRPDHNRYPVNFQDIALNEVHLYSQIPINDSGHLSIPLKNFDRIDVYQPDKKSTNKSTVGSIVGITLTTAAVVGVIVAIADAPKTDPNPQPQTVNCSPQVYLTDNDHTELQGTLYSGALYASLERTDYLPIHVPQPDGNKLQLTVQGKKEEDIFVHGIHLMQVTHNDKEQALIDRKGQILIYHDPVSPEKADIGGHASAGQEILARDGKYYSFTNHPKGENSSDIILDFKKPKGISTGKLIINAKNSRWSYYLFSQFKSLYGDSYPGLLLRKDKADPKKVLQCELDQSLPLLVSVKDKSGWKFVDYFPTSGNTRDRDLIMNMDLSEFSSSDHIQIRLQTTFMFWDLDYAGMDFSQENSYQIAILPVSKQFTENPGTDPAIRFPDDHSSVEINGGEQLRMEFTIQSKAGNGLKNSYFLEGTGYYHDNTAFEGKPRYAELIRFTGKGAFDKYSREKFASLVKNLRDQSKTEIVSAK
jgi:hypothetical protein